MKTSRAEACPFITQDVRRSNQPRRRGIFLTPLRVPLRLEERSFLAKILPLPLIRPYDIYL